jgi:hypothetical protein
MICNKARITRGFAVAIAIVGLVIGLGNPANAVIVGLPANPLDGNCIPFGCDLGITRYQQLYPSTAFSGPMTITQINFFQFADSRLPPGDLVSATFSLSLSTTSKQIGGLDSVDMNNNVGTDAALFTVETLTGGPAGSMLSFVGQPFFYDPALDNLLLDIQLSALSHAGITAFFLAPASFGVVSRCVSIGGPACFPDDLGIVTQFTSNAAPEPATLVLLATGLACLGFSRRRALMAMLP